MHLSELPATTFPILQEAIIEQTSLRDWSFERYLDSAEFVGNIMQKRMRAVRLLIETQLPNSFREQTDYLENMPDTVLDYHGKVFCFYLLGMYQQASLLIENHFRKENPIFHSQIQKIKDILAVDSAETYLNDSLHRLAMKEDLDLILSTRIKGSGSLFAKLFTIKKLSVEKLPELKPTDIYRDLMPYDLVGGSIFTNKMTQSSFTEFIQRVFGHFAKDGITLVDQNAYFSNWMNRKSLVGKMKIESDAVPFQLHIWDMPAKRYEFMSYGNYKLHKVFYPLLLNWRDYLATDFAEVTYTRLVIASLSRHIDKKHLLENLNDK